MGRRKTSSTIAIAHAHATTIQASVVFSQNMKGSSTHSVIRSRNAESILPVRNSRTLWTWLMLYIVSPAGYRSK